MNQIISNKKTMLGLVLGIALVAVIGTVSVYADTQSSTITRAPPGGGMEVCTPSGCHEVSGNNGSMPINSSQFVTMPTIQGSININQLLMQSVKTKFVDAANTAQSAVTGGTVTGGQLGPYQGYYVYNFQVLDSTGKIHFVIVDAGNDQVLSNTEAPEGFSGMPGKVVMFHDIGGPMGDVSYQAMGSEGPVVIQAVPNK